MAKAQILFKVRLLYIETVNRIHCDRYMHFDCKSECNMQCMLQ